MLKKTILSIILVVFALLSIGGTASAQTETNRFFSDTGHWLVGPFYDFYMDYEFAEIIYGSPITEQFFDRLSGRMVQYFQNVRFELYPENPPGLQVIVKSLGEILYHPGIPIELSPFTPNCRQAMGWSHPVCFSFLDFYHAKGGEVRFGKPISGMEFTKGHLVQHFEFARFVWKPGHPEGAQVTVAPLGEEYFSVIGEDRARLEPDRTPQYTFHIHELNLRTFTKHAMVPDGGYQTLYVMVRDQNLAAVIGARVTLTAQFPDGSTETFDTVATNGMGLAVVDFPVTSDALGLAELSISVIYSELNWWSLWWSQ